MALEPDVMTIVSRQSKNPKYIVLGDKVVNLERHEHQMDWDSSQITAVKICVICKKTVAQILEEEG